MLIKELSQRAPHAQILHRSFPGLRFADVVCAALERMEREKALRSVDYITWTSKWDATFGTMMSERVRDQLWKRAVERAEFLRAPRRRAAAERQAAAEPRRMGERAASTANMTASRSMPWSAP